MSNLIRSEEAFTRFIEEYRDEKEDVKYEQAISEMAARGLKSLIIDFTDLYAFDEDLARVVLDNPLDHLPLFDIAAFSKLRMCDPMYASQIRRVHVRFKDLPIEMPLQMIRAEHIGHLVKVKCIVTRAMDVKPRLIKSAFRCKSCGEIVILDQSGQLLKVPEECPQCNTKKGFTRADIIPGESVYINFQELIVSGFILGLDEERKGLSVEICNDIVGIAKPEDQVIITGVVGARHLDKTIEATLYIKGNYLEIEKEAETYTQDIDLQIDLKKVLGVIGEMERVSGVVQDEDLFTALLEDHSIARSEAAQLIGILMRDGTIFSPRPGYYKKTT